MKWRDYSQYVWLAVMLIIWIVILAVPIEPIRTAKPEEIIAFAIIVGASIIAGAIRRG